MRLRASQLTKDFGHRTIVKNATLSVHPGEVVTIFGPNGAGKTTLIKILATLLKPTSGNSRLKVQMQSQMTRTYVAHWEPLFTKTSLIPH